MASEMTADSTLLLVLQAVQSQGQQMRHCHLQHQAAEYELDMLLNAIAGIRWGLDEPRHTFHLQGVIMPDCAGCAWDRLYATYQGVIQFRRARGHR